MKMNVLGVGLVIFFSGGVLGQQTLLGKYTGTYVQAISRGDVNQSLTLEITSVDGDTVKGKAVRTAQRQGACNGEYPVEGTVKGNDLNLKSLAKGGPAGDCNMALKLTVEGNKLVGMMNSFKTELSK
jgi:hypothetical protein